MVCLIVIMDVYFMTNDSADDDAYATKPHPTTAETTPCGLITEIRNTLDGLGGIRIHTTVQVHATDRVSPEDYEKKILFSRKPATGKCFELGDTSMFVCDGYSAARFLHKNTEFYALFKADLTDNAWNIVKHLLPPPEEVYNCSQGVHCAPATKVHSTLFVDTSCKRALLDKVDFFGAK